MKKIDRLLREILCRFYEGSERFFKQKELAEVCGLSLGTVNPLIAKLGQLRIIERKPLGFRVIDVGRLLSHWAVTRDLAKDIRYATHVPSRIPKLEADLPSDSIRTAYSGFRSRFGSCPGDYDEVYVYADPKQVKQRFKPAPLQRPNLFVLESDEHLERLSSEGVAPLPQLYVDLWQLGGPANRFLEELSHKLEEVRVSALEAMIRAVRRKREK